MKVEEVIANLHEGINDPGIFKAIFMAGGPGSGKSTVAGKLGLFAMGLRPINSDPFFEQALKKAGLSLKLGTLDPELIDTMRVKAKRLGGKQMDLALNGRLGLVIDSTARNMDKIKKQKAALEALGYDTAMVFVDTSLETALERNQMRARSVPDAVVRNSHEEIRAQAKKLKGLFGTNFWNVSNDGDMQSLAKETNKWYSKIMNWVNKRPNNNQAKDWIKQFESLEVDMQNALLGLNELDLRTPARRDVTRMKDAMASSEKKLWKRLIANPKLAVKELQATIDLFKKQYARATGLTQPIIKAQIDKYEGWLSQLQKTALQTEAAFKPDRHVLKMVKLMTDKELKQALKDQHKTELPMKLVMHIKYEMKERGLKEGLNEFNDNQLNALRKTYGKIKKIDPESPEFKKLRSFISGLDKSKLKALAAAEPKVPWLSYLASMVLKDSVDEALTEENLQYISELQLHEAVKLPPNVEDVQMSTLYTLLHTAVMKKLDKLPATAPVALQMLNGINKVGKEIKPQMKLRGIEAIRAFVKATSHTFTGQMPPLSTMARKYKLKTDFQGNIIESELEEKFDIRKLKIANLDKLRKDPEQSAKEIDKIISDLEKQVKNFSGSVIGKVLQDEIAKWHRVKSYAMSESDDMTEEEFKVLNEAVAPAPESPTPASDTTTKSIPKAVGISPDGKFGGSPVFDCDNATFSNCIKGKKKYGRWSVYLGQDNPFYKKMQSWMGQSYKNKNFILRNASTGEMTFARRMHESQELDEYKYFRNSTTKDGKIAKIDAKKAAVTMLKKFKKVDSTDVKPEDIMKVLNLKALSNLDFEDIKKAMAKFESVNEGREDWQALKSLLGMDAFKFGQMAVKEIQKMKKSRFKNIPNPGSHIKSVRITDVRISDPADPIGSHTAVDFELEWTGATSLAKKETFSIAIEQDANNEKVAIYSFLSKPSRGTYRMNVSDKPAMVLSSLIHRFYDNIILEKVYSDIKGFADHYSKNPPRQPLPGAGRR